MQLLRSRLLDGPPEEVELGGEGGGAIVSPSFFKGFVMGNVSAKSDANAAAAARTRGALDGLSRLVTCCRTPTLVDTGPSAEVMGANVLSENVIIYFDTYYY